MDASNQDRAHRTESRVGFMVMGTGVLLSAAWLLFGLVSWSNPGGPGFEVLFLGLGGAILVVGAAFTVMGLGFGPLHSRQPLAWIGVAAIPVAFALLYFAVQTDFPLRVRLELSDSQLEAHGEAVRAGKVSSDEPRQVGKFTVRRTVLAGECSIFVTNSGLFSDSGLGHCPPGERPRVSGAKFRPIKDQWWEARGVQ